MSRRSPSCGQGSHAGLWSGPHPRGTKQDQAKENDLEAARVLPSEQKYVGPIGHDEIQKGRVVVVSEEHRPDVQAELANEQTYLSWLRTGLALVAVGVAAEQVLPAAGISGRGN